jgi:SAM-dependent methyltransferase
MFDRYADIFAERGAAYHGAMAACPSARHAEFEAAIAPLEGYEGLLCDMPSGGGYLAAHLPSGMRYLGVDPSDDFIDACPLGLERIKADVTNVPRADGSVDCLVSLAGLHHEADLGAVFAEMRRLLKPGGRAVIADAAVGTAPARFLNGFVDRNNPMGHDGHFLDERTPAFLEEAGFTIADDRLLQTPWRFDSREEAGAFCRQLFGMPSLTPEAVAEAMEREIGFVRSRGGLHLKWELRRIVCDAV